MLEGRVIEAVKALYRVDLGGRILNCRLRGSLRKRFEYEGTAERAGRVARAVAREKMEIIALGDRVIIEESDSNEGIILEVLPRQSQFSRLGFRGQTRTMVCNLDQAVIAFSVAEPRLDPWKLDRFVIASELQGLSTLICVNKCDLIADPAILNCLADFRHAGYPVVMTSAILGTGLEELKRYLAGKLSVITGPSGVGKSSLLNAIEPNLNLHTAATGSITHQGRHTTTSGRLIPLECGGWVADTPGLRRFDLLESDAGEIAQAFVEFRPFLGTCRFHNCGHSSEPGCEVQAAVEAGLISRRRLESMLQLIVEAAQRN